MTAIEDRPQAADPQRTAPGFTERLRWALGIALSDRHNRGRLTTMALGVGLCAFVLLALASVAPTLDRLAERSAARAPLPAAEGLGLAYRDVDTTIDGTVLRGRLLQAGDDLPAPPGADHYPAAGETLVSPALAALLADPDEETLRLVLGAPTGVLTEDGLTGPAEIWFYQGVPDLGTDARWASGWGGRSTSTPIDPRIWMILVTGVTVLMVPLLLFTALAARVGSARRERRDGVLRLLGASRRQLRTLVAAEALLASVVGLFLAVAVLLLLRQAAAATDIAGRALPAADIGPSLTTGLAVVVGVPLLGVAAGLVGTRQSAGSPLDRGAESRRPRAGWRIALLAAAVAGSAMALGVPFLLAAFDNVLVLCVLILLWLFAVAALVGLVTYRLVRRVDAAGLSYQLARGRVLADGPVTSRAAAAIGTVLAGSIALMSLLTLVVEPDDGTPTPAMVTSGFVQLPVDQWERLATSLRDVDGVDSVAISAELSAPAGSDSFTSVTVADCGTVDSYFGIADCTDGAVYAEFQSTPEQRKSTVDLQVGPDGSVVPWTPRDVITRPGTAPADPAFVVDWYLLTTGAYLDQIGDETAVSTYVSISLEPATLAAAQRAVSWLGMDVAQVFGIYNPIDAQTVGWLRIGLVTSGLLVLAICVLGLWLLAAEQIRERRRAFALARAAGVPTRTLGGSVVLEAVTPVVVAVPLAVAVGWVVGWLIQALLGSRVGVDAIRIDWSWTIWASVIALAVTGLAAAAAAWRLRAVTGPEALRTE